MAKNKEVEKILKKWFPASRYDYQDNGTLVIHYPEITCKHVSGSQTYTLRDMYVKLGIGVDGRLSDGFYVLGARVPENARVVHIVHPHAPGDPGNYVAPCSATETETPVEEAYDEFTPERFKSLLVAIKAWLESDNHSYINYFCCTGTRLEKIDKLPEEKVREILKRIVKDENFKKLLRYDFSGDQLRVLQNMAIAALIRKHFPNLPAAYKIDDKWYSHYGKSKVWHQWDSPEKFKGKPIHVKITEGEPPPDTAFIIHPTILDQVCSAFEQELRNRFYKVPTKQTKHGANVDK